MYNLYTSGPSYWFFNSTTNWAYNMCSWATLDVFVLYVVYFDPPNNLKIKKKFLFKIAFEILELSSLFKQDGLL